MHHVVVSIVALVLVQCNLDSKKSSLNSLLAYAAKFCLTYLGPAVGSTEICHFLSTCPGFCAWTGAEHRIKLILMVLLQRLWIFAPQGSLSLDMNLPCCWHKALFLFSWPSWEHVVHAPAKHKSASIPVGKLQDWMQKYQPQPMSLLLVAKTQIYIYFAWEVPGFVSVQKLRKLRSTLYTLL